MLKQILKKHCLQRPPYSIFIFTEEEASMLTNFMLRTFFRHYSLYEYSFKPKIDLILMTLPPGGRQQEDKLLEESVHEANAMNDGIGSLDLEGAGLVSSHPADRTSGLRDSNLEQDKDQSSLKPSSPDENKTSQ